MVPIIALTAGALQSDREEALHRAMSEPLRRRQTSAMSDPGVPMYPVRRRIGSKKKRLR
jgi:hypothetical protein